MEIEHKRSAIVLIFNTQGELALQLRAANDDSFPSHWDFAAGGGIDEGENEQEAAERELREELGVEAKTEFIAYKKYTYPAWKPGVMREVELWIYEAQYDGPFTPDPNEVEKAGFFNLDEIEKMMESGERFHPEFKLAWEDGLIKRS